MLYVKSKLRSIPINSTSSSYHNNYCGLPLHDYVLTLTHTHIPTTLTQRDIITTATTMSWIPLIRFRDDDDAAREWRVNHTRRDLHLQHLRLWAKSDLHEQSRTNITRIWNKEPLWTLRNSHKSRSFACLLAVCLLAVVVVDESERECENRNQEHT